MTTTVTKRITASVSDGNTRRVNLTGHHTTYDCWSLSWGTSWKNTWYNFLSASELPENITLRVPSGAAASITKRVTGI